MTIDDFDVNAISDKLAIRDETESPQTLEAAHDDGHEDIAAGHDDLVGPPCHDDGWIGHGDTHFDAFDDAPHDDHNDGCPPGGCTV